MVNTVNSTRQIVHIIVDDKFIDNALRQFDSVAPQRNISIMIGAPHALRYIKRQRILFQSLEQAQMLLQSDKCAAVVFHSLPDRFLPLLQSIPAGKKVVWIGWGYDYYDRLLSRAFPNGLLMPETMKLMGQAAQLPIFETAANICKEIVKRVIFGRARNPIRAALSRIDYFSPVLDIEHSMARELNPWFKAEYMRWNYGTAEEDFGGDQIDTVAVNNDNIIIGNSATPENNHIEIFKTLRKYIDISGRKILVPLSYGNKIYGQKIVDIGRELFGSDFVPLMDFVADDEYMQLINGCGYVFMNHVRQQAMGNLLIMMLKGSKIYMNAESPALKWLLSKGAIIHSATEIHNKTSAEIFKPISADARKINRAVVINHWGKVSQHQKTRQLIDSVLRN